MFTVDLTVQKLQYKTRHTIIKTPTQTKQKKWSNLSVMISVVTQGEPL